MLFRNLLLLLLLNLQLVHEDIALRDPLRALDLDNLHLLRWVVQTPP